MALSERFVARIVIEKVVVEDGKQERGIVPTQPNKIKSTIANIVIGNEDLEALKGKVSQHIALVEDGGDIDERRNVRG